MTKFLTAVVGKLPSSVQPYAKAFVPAGVAAALAVQDLTVSAVEFDEIKLLTIGAVSSLLTLAIPNLGYRPPAK